MAGQVDAGSILMPSRMKVAKAKGRARGCSSPPTCPRDLLAGVDLGDVTVYSPVLRAHTPAMVADLDAKLLAHVRDQLGITST